MASQPIGGWKIRCNLARLFIFRLPLTPLQATATAPVAAAAIPQADSFLADEGEREEVEEMCSVLFLLVMWPLPGSRLSLVTIERMYTRIVWHGRNLQPYAAKQTAL